MHSTGLPVQIGGSGNLSTSSSQELRLANVPFSSETRDTSLVSPGNPVLLSQGNNMRPDFSQSLIVHTNIDCAPVSSHASFGTAGSGLSAFCQNVPIHDPSGNVQNLQLAVLDGGQQQKNLSTNSDQQKHQTSFQLLVNSVKSSLDQKTTKSKNDSQPIQLGENQCPLDARKHQKQLVSPKLPLYPMAARARGKMPVQMEKRKPNPEKQPLVEKQIEGKVLHEKSGVDSAYKPGKGAERLNQYILQLKNRPNDNNIQFWRNLVAEFFAPSAMKRWCVSSYKNIEQINNLFKVPWQCDICNVKPCCGFEITEELLPRLHQIKYDIGILEEHLRLDTPNEYMGSCGQIFLHYSKAAEESEYEQARLVRNGQLRVVFSPDLKICSWEFCVQHHEEYIRRNSLSSKVSQLGAALQNYKLSVQDSSSLTPEELQRRTETFISSAHQMVDALGMPFTSQIGNIKRYERCLQISEMFNIMHDLIDFSQENGLSPTESITRFPHVGSNVSYGKNFYQQPKQQQSPAAPSAPYLEPSASLGPTNHKRQRTDSTCAQITSIGFTTPSFSIQPYSGPSNPDSINADQITSYGFTTPSFNAQPHAGPSNFNSLSAQITSVGFTTPSLNAQPHAGPSSGGSINARITSVGFATPSFNLQPFTGPSSPKNINTQITSIGFTTPLYSVQPHAGPSSTGSIKAQITSVGFTTPSFNLQPHAGPSSSNNINAPVNNSCGDNSLAPTVIEYIDVETYEFGKKAIDFIDVENHEFGKKAIDFSVGTSTNIDVENHEFGKKAIDFSAGTSSSAQTSGTMLLKDAKGHYVSYDDFLFDELVDFGDLHELLE